MQKNTSLQILARTIPKFMDARGIKSHNELAKKAKVSQTQVSRVLRGESCPTADMLDLLADALGVRTWELLVDEDATRRAALEGMLGLGPKNGRGPK